MTTNFIHNPTCKRKLVQMLLVCGYLICVGCEVYGQSDEKQMLKRKSFQVSVVPGFGTNGMDYWYSENDISINLISGYSAGNTLLEIGVISNLNYYRVKGLQLGGLFNVVGKKTFKSNSLRPTDVEYFGNVSAFQMAGIANKVHGGGGGFQVSGLYNFVNKTYDGVQVSGFLNGVNEIFAGIQIAGGFNFCKEFVLGVQVAGISNSAIKSFEGVQVSAGMNYTSGTLTGYQIGTLNRARQVDGRYALQEAKVNSIQFGALNSAVDVNGFQIGLINRCKELNGFQIGLINLSKKHNGTSVGLINIASRGDHFRLFATESFISNIEISTGSRKLNSQRTLQNNILFSYNTDPSRYRYALGYGLGTVVYSINPERDNKFFHSDFQVSYVGNDLKFSRNGQVVGKIRAFVGKRILATKPYYIFAGVSLNCTEERETTEEKLNISPVNFAIDRLILWPGYSLGLQIH